jgi:hypothetical protein
MTTTDNQFIAVGSAETGFKTNSTSINVGAVIAGRQGGIRAICTGPGDGEGVQGTGSGTLAGVTGFGGLNDGAGVVGLGRGTNGQGVRGIGAGSLGAFTANPHGVQGIAGPTAAAAGVHGVSNTPNGNGVIGEASNGSIAYGIWGISTSGYAGYFTGDVYVTGTLSKGGGGFRIDHPLDPENKYLSHSFVESPDMLNIYNGDVTTDANGDATVLLPDYFEALNQDFRYQLTVIGQFAQAIVAEEVKNNQFTIKTDKPQVKVCWQITGVRKDLFANSHRIEVEEDKPANERGTYLHPEAHGKPEIQGVEYAHEKRLKGP